MGLLKVFSTALRYLMHRGKPKEMTELQFRKLGLENFACCLIVISTKFSMGVQWWQIVLCSFIYLY